MMVYVSNLRILNYTSNHAKWLNFQCVLTKGELTKLTLKEVWE